MRYQTLALHCECGMPTKRIREVGFTADHQLILHWLCAHCKRHVYAVKSLAECWRDCPSREALRQSSDADTPASRETDANFLRALGIEWPEAVS